MNDASFVLSDRTKGAAAETTALDRDRKTNHLVGGNIGLAVHGVWLALERQIVDPVHLMHGQRNGRRIEPQILIAVTLHQGAGVTGVGFQVQDARGVCI